MESFSFGVIGSGAMAEAILTGVIASKTIENKDIIAADINQNKLDYLEKKLGIRTNLSNDFIFESAKSILLSVKPQHLKSVVLNLKEGSTKGKLIISIMAGVSLEKLEGYFPETAIVRVMPNTPSLVGEGMAALCKNNLASDEDLKIAQKIFDSVGKTVLLEEKMLDAVTGLSGSSPAYVYQFIEALADGGVLAGLPRDISYQLAAQTVLGSAKMVLETKKHPGELKDQVTSPAGTTIAGVKSLEKNKFRAAVIEAVEEGYLRSKELSKTD